MRDAVSGSDAAYRELLSKLMKMGFWRIAAVGSVALGSASVARCLGPEKIGISGMVQAFGQQALLLVTMGLPTLLIRDYKRSDDATAQDAIISLFTSYRVLVAALISISWAVIAIFTKLESSWWLATAAGILTVAAGAWNSEWLLQAQENQVLQQRLMALSGFATATLLFLLVRPGSATGIDLAIVALVAAAVTCLGRYCALRGRHKETVSWRYVMAAWPVMWRARWVFLSTVLIYIYVRFETPLLAWLRSVDELGQYRSALQLVNGIQPILTLVPALLYPRMIEWAKEGREVLWRRQLRVSAFILWVGLPAVIIGFFLIPLVYPFIYGPEFQAAAVPCCILVAAKLAVLLNGIYGWGLWSVAQDVTMLAIMGVAAVASLGLNIILIPRFGMLGAASVNLFSELLILAGVFYFQRRYCLNRGL